MSRLFEKNDLHQTRFRAVPVRSLIATPVSPDNIHLMGMGTSGLKNPSQLSIQAIKVATTIQPMLVVPHGTGFEVVGNFRTFALAQLLSSDQRVGVLELRGPLASMNNLARVAAFFTTSVLALEPQTANQQFLRAVHLMSEETCTWVSPSLCSRLRQQQLLNIRRQDQLSFLESIRSDFSRLLDQDEDIS